MKIKNIKKLVVLFCLMILFLSNISFIFAATTEPDLTAKGVILLDTNSGRVLYSKNETEKMYPASTTKILTAILTLENCKLDDVVTIDYDVSSTIPYGYTIVELQIGEKFTIEQLLEMLLVHSANDVASLLAKHVGGSIEGFADMMNKKIQELGLSNTHFTNPSGIHDDNHYTTAKDLATIMEYCIKNKEFVRLASMPSCSIPANDKHIARTYESTDRLVVQSDSKNYYPYLVCGKTGYTDPAGECLVSCANKDDLELVCVILGGETIDNNPTRYSETKTLYEYGYNNFSVRKIVDKDDYVEQIKVKNGALNTRDLTLVASTPVTALLADSETRDNIKTIVNLKDNISAPINQGDILGTVSYKIDGKEYTTELIASHTVEKSNLLYYMIEIFIGIVLILIVFLIFSNRKK